MKPLKVILVLGLAGIAIFVLSRFMSKSKTDQGKIDVVLPGRITKAGPGLTDVSGKRIVQIS